jgi:hypothetical protein
MLKMIYDPFVQKIHLRLLELANTPYFSVGILLIAIQMQKVDALMKIMTIGNIFARIVNAA